MKPNAKAKLAPPPSPTDRLVRLLRDRGPGAFTSYFDVVVATGYNQANSRNPFVASALARLRAEGLRFQTSSHGLLRVA